MVATGPPDRNAKAIIVDGGYRVTGQLACSPAAAGTRNGSAATSTVCERDGTPRLGPDGKPLEQRTMLFPKSSATMTDVWQVMGLKGTGSDNYAVQRPVRAGGLQLHARIRRRPARDRAALPLLDLQHVRRSAFCAVALGIARTVLDDFIKLAKEKAPFIRRLRCCATTA